MPNLYCTLQDSDFTSYDTIQEIIAGSDCRSVKEKEIHGHVIIHVSFVTVNHQDMFIQKAAERLPLIPWRDKL